MTRHDRKREERLLLTSILIFTIAITITLVFAVFTGGSSGSIPVDDLPA